MATLQKFTLTDDPKTWMQHLSPRRQEIIQQVMQNPREFVLLSVRASAERLGTDPATVVRIIQRMGFENYRAFQNYLHGLSIANGTSLDGMQARTHENAQLPDHLQAMLEQDFKNLNAIRNMLDVKRIAQVAKKITSAKRVLILGGDMAENLVHTIEYGLTLIGIVAHSATTSGRSAHVSRLFGKGDLVIAISFRRGLRQTVEALKKARENGAYCIGITGSYVTPIARFTDEFFVASVESESFIDSYVAPMALLNLLLVACANVDREATMLRLREAAKEQRDGFRWYDKS
jgi:RpiR family carbohydrate utilization transcriptional regulator